MMVLENTKLQVILADDKEYSGTRFDHTLTVKQILLDGHHTFLGHEETPEGIGTGGFGLHCGWLWRTPLNNFRGYPIPGIGIISLPNDQDYSIRRIYPYIPALRTIILKSETQCIVESLIPDFCKIERKVELFENGFTLSTCIRNLSSEVFKIDEYCHDFLCFDGYPIDHNVRVSFSSPLLYSVVRGELKIGRHWYEPEKFDEDLGTIALSCEKSVDKTYPHTVVISDHRTGTYISIRDGFDASHGYQWISEHCICPESFNQMTINPKNDRHFFREFKVGAISEL